MSFLDTLFDFGASALNLLTSNSTGGAIARAVGSAIILNQTQDTVKKENTVPVTAQTQNATQPDLGVREQVDPDTNNSIPVVYGTAFTGGIVTDAVMTGDNLVMWYCLTICERTGNLINGTPSVINIDAVYWNQNEVIFQSDGVTVNSFKDEDGGISTNPNGLIEMHFYNNGSSSQVFPLGTSGSSIPAYSRFPNWTGSHTMNQLVFCLVKVTYSKEKQITGLGNLEFKVRNTMTEAGDVINDYLTNSRYGAGIVPEEINA
jgi:uncharacterized Fe-S cluster protein YjdI